MRVTGNVFAKCMKIYCLTILSLLLFSAAIRAQSVSCASLVTNYRFGDEVPESHRQLIRAAIANAATIICRQTGVSVEKLTVQAYADLESISQAYAEFFSTPVSEARSMWLAGNSVVSGPKAIFYYTGNQWLAGVLKAADSKALIEVSGHEFFHVAQWQLMNGKLIGKPDSETPVGGPRWLIEGTAMVAGAIAGDSAGLRTYSDRKEEHKARAVTTKAELKTIENWAGLAAAGKAGYPLSFMACDFLAQVSRSPASPLQAFVTFWRDIGKGKTWEAAFAAVFSQDVATFYQRFVAYQLHHFLPLPAVCSMTCGAQAPVIIAATFDRNRTLMIAGKHFGVAPQVLINDVKRNEYLVSASSTLLQVQAKAQKLGLKPGINSIQVITVHGVASFSAER